MDSVELIKTEIYNLLTNDAALKAAFPNEEVKLDNVWVESEEVMPYMSYRIFVIPSASLDVVGVATLSLDIFDKDPSQQRILTIRARVNKLLEGVTISTSDGHIRIRKTLDTEVPEDNRYVWHITTDWIIRYTRELEMSLLEG